MRRGLVLLMLLAAALLICGRPALALDCAIRPPGEYLAKSQIAVEGRVASVSWFSSDSGPVSLRVERVYKGSAPGSLPVVSTGWDPLVKGERYLLFLRWEPAEGAWKPLLCGGTHGLNGALPAEYAAALGEGWGPAVAAPGGPGGGAAWGALALGLVGGAVLLAGAGVWGWRVLARSRG